MNTPDDGNAGTHPTGPAGSGPGRNLFAELEALLTADEIAASRRRAAADPPLTADQAALLLALYQSTAKRNTRPRAA